MEKMVNNTASYTINGTTLSKWNGQQAIIDMQSDPVLRKIETIGESAFHNCRSLTEITLPEGLKMIQEEAFSVCLSLKKINLPDSLTTIEEAAFAHCIALEEIVLPEHLTSITAMVFLGCAALKTIEVHESNRCLSSHEDVLYSKDGSQLIRYPQGKTDARYTVLDGVKTIGFAAFEGNILLQSVKLPEGLNTIEELAFDGCSALRAINLPEGLRSIEEAAFRNCISLTSLHLPDSLESIGEELFAGCTSLTKIEVSESNKEFSTDAGVLYNSKKTELIFYPQGKMEEDFDLPASVAIIKKNAFSGCKGLKEIYFSKSSTLKTIESGAFYQCSALRNFNLPDSVERIEAAALSECIGLRTVFLPKNLKEIGDSAFFGCLSLKNISCFAATPPKTGANAFDYIGCDPLLYIREKNLSVYEGTAMWNRKFYIFKITEWEKAKGSRNSVPAKKNEGVLKREKTIDLNLDKSLQDVA